MSTSWLWLSIFQSGSSLLRCQTNHHNTNQAFLQKVLSRFGAGAKCLTDQGSEFRGEIQDLFDHAFIDHHQTSRDHPQADGLVERMVQTCKKRLWKICLTRNKEDWDLTLSWVTRCPNTPLCFISLLTFYFLGDIPFHPLPLMLKWTRLWTWTSQPLGLGSSYRRLLYLGGLCPWPWKTCPLHNIETPYSMHTHEVAITNLRWDNLMLVILCISSGNLMILYTLLPIALSWGVRRSSL